MYYKITNKGFDEILKTKKVKMTEVKCNECGKLLFITKQNSLGAIGAEAQHKGFVYKNACLFSDKYSSLYFCSDECGKNFYKKNIPKNPEVTKKLNELKKEIPEMAKEVSNKMAKLVETLKKRK